MFRTTSNILVPLFNYEIINIYKCDEIKRKPTHNVYGIDRVFECTITQIDALDNRKKTVFVD